MWHIQIINSTLLATSIHPRKNPTNNPNQDACIYVIEYHKENRVGRDTNNQRYRWLM